jgi:hypothetical protein
LKGSIGAYLTYPCGEDCAAVAACWVGVSGSIDCETGSAKLNQTKSLKAIFTATGADRFGAVQRRDRSNRGTAAARGDRDPARGPGAEPLTRARLGGNRRSARVKALQPAISNRAIAGALGVDHQADVDMFLSINYIRMCSYVFTISVVDATHSFNRAIIKERLEECLKF